MSFEALLGDSVVRLELDPHVVLLGGDDLGFLHSTELPMKLWVWSQPTAHLHIIIFTHLMVNTGQFYLRQFAWEIMNDFSRLSDVSVSVCIWKCLQKDYDILPINRKTSLSLTYIIPFGLEHIEHQSDAILNGCHQLPHTVLVGWVFFGPPGGGEGAIKLGDEPTTGSCWWEKTQW